MKFGNIPGHCGPLPVDLIGCSIPDRHHISQVAGLAGDTGVSFMGNRLFVTVIDVTLKTVASFLEMMLIPVCTGMAGHAIQIRMGGFAVIFHIHHRYRLAHPLALVMAGKAECLVFCHGIQCQHDT